MSPNRGIISNCQMRILKESVFITFSRQIGESQQTPGENRNNLKSAQ